jgi:transcriptional regulator with XRE-family HTH domain
VKEMTLREARRLRGWTQEQLEERSGVEQAVISRVERGANRNPGIKTVRKLETALNVRLIFGAEEAQAS